MIPWFRVLNLIFILEESNMKSFKVNAEVWDLINALWGKQELG